jgi:tRNA (mo5U34)-methyltransferase
MVMTLDTHAAEFSDRLATIRAADESVAWYPYGSMSNVQHLEGILPADVFEQLDAGTLNWSVLDVGAADGDLGYFFESRGCSVDFLDNPPTNFNGCRAIRALADALNSPAQLIVQDIDQQFTLGGQYDFALALGLLYHLRNPMGFLMTLAMHVERMVLSTRVARQLPDGTPIHGHAVAYLLRRRETNDDPTNYWVMSPLGLETMLTRCGWQVEASRLVGAAVSNPVDNDADQRMFVYCQRVPHWRDLGKHHDF